MASRKPPVPGKYLDIDTKVHVVPPRSDEMTILMCHKHGRMELPANREGTPCHLCKAEPKTTKVTPPTPDYFPRMRSHRTEREESPYRITFHPNRCVDDAPQPTNNTSGSARCSGRRR